MRNNLLSVGLVCLFVCNILAQTCSLSASIAARPGASWVTNGVSQQIFDISITNTGSCSFSAATVALSLPSGSSISESWNIDSTTFLVSGFGTLNAGATYAGAGIVISHGGVPTISSSSATCNSPCSGSTSAPTSAPTPAATSAPTSAPTNAPASCQLSVSQTRRTSTDGSWTSGEFTYQIYDLAFTNTGSKTLTYAQYIHSFMVGYPSSHWNLVKTCCIQIKSAVTYNVTLPSAGLEPASVTYAGFVLEYGTGTALADPNFNSPIVGSQVVCNN